MKKALLIGINYIGTNSQLNGCINDVINIRNYLIRERKFDPKNIAVLTEASKKKQPTKKNILHWLDWFVTNNPENSFLFFHYSGHGSFIKDKSGDEADKRDETIVPLDYNKAGMIVDDDLYKIFDRIAGGNKVICIFDACHSGTILDLKYNYKFNSNPKNDSYKIETNKKYKKTNAEIVLFSGCMDKQYSADSFEAGKAQGAMTYCFLETIKKLNAKKKKITYKRLVKNLHIFIKKKGYEQIPQLSSGTLLNLNAEF